MSRHDVCSVVVLLLYKGVCVTCHVCCGCRSATEALKLVGEMFPFRSGSSSTGSSMMQHEPGPRSELDMLPGTLRPQQQQQLAAGLADGLLDTDGTNSNRSSSSSTGKSSNAGSKFVYTRSNHNSVLGIGAYAAAAGAQLVPQTDDGMEAWVASLEQQQQQQEESTAGSAPTYNLLAYPAEDNYAGVLYPLQWINRVRERGGVEHDSQGLPLYASGCIPRPACRRPAACTHDSNMAVGGVCACRCVQPHSQGRSAPWCFWMLPPTCPPMTLT